MRWQRTNDEARQLSRRMRPYTTKEKAGITAGAVASLVIVGVACRAGYRVSIGTMKEVAD
jgi:hypothetical protein